MLIDRDKLLRLARSERKTCGKDYDFYGLFSDIEYAPIVDAEPVVHARWVEPVPGDGFPYCGNCKAPALNKGLFLNPKLMDWYKTKYCPNCGAKMDLEEPQCTSTDTEL